MPLILVLSGIVIAGDGELASPAATRPNENVKKFSATLIDSIPNIKASEIQSLPGRPPRPEKKNYAFYSNYLQRFAHQIRQSSMTPAEKINLYAFLVVETHRKNGIGYLWGGDMLDLDPDPTSKGGVGYDCSGYIWSVYLAIQPNHSFTNRTRRLNARDYLPLGREVIPLAAVDESFHNRLLERAKIGDIMIAPAGHICLFGSHPLTGETIVLENGYEWAPLSVWVQENKGKTYCVRR